MIAKLLIAFGLMSLCVAIHAVGLATAFRWLNRSRVTNRSLWRWIALLVVVAGWAIFIHLIEITVWALFYAWNENMPDAQSAFYFSMVTYTTTGYGDLVLPKAWRLV